MTVSTSRVRRVVADHYEIEDERPLGVGGMALVYKGRDLRTRRTVALKTLKPEWQQDSSARSRFRHEARTMAFLTHPSVARVYDLYEPNQQTEPWVVLEFIDGPSLRQELDRGGPLDIDRAAHVLNQLAAALAHLHQRGMSHLDVKPQNILFADPMTVKLIDFGIAQPSGTSSGTADGQAFGSVSYVSPEQASGQPLGPASDVYSLGCVVYEMVTGTPVYQFPDGTNPQVLLAAHLTGIPDLPSERRPDLNLPDWVDDIILDALRREPDHRYPSTVAFAKAFEGALEAATPPDSTVPLGQLPRFDPRRNPTVVTREPSPVFATRHGPPLVSRVRTRFLWKLIGIIAIANVLLAGLSFWDKGVVPGLYDPAVTIERGTHVTVTAETLNVREAPTEDAEVVDRVALGLELTATGFAQGGWIPVTYDVDEDERSGYVAVSHVEAEPRSGYQRVRGWLDSIIP